ncbi:aminoacyl-tRNA hydrolase [Subsaxibacter sp. CAU 1640]|uniref:alternative ribosome rescue aminoacyl-tRNA hydrolase ArfB n=1 Tax=Subsaxibacter sp. CAU 1640 TaxID=2933271 RepID=UPI0020040735|nr:alternative ribosome rescue aminoacyl-tRNA hydrolase ArfB [Subsaxibacter sp. CAU 1640]MCK7589201.1 aminoacyl-tRNA hydrolase [Subsaxibacter sp. CAU 1640]
MDVEVLNNELQFKAVRSSGAGGQKVNKVSSKVELTFNLEASNGLSDEEKERLKTNISHRLTKDNLLLMQCDESRSQHKNKELVIKRFFELLEEGLVVPKERKATKVPKAVVKKRLKAKRQTSEKKANRKPPEIE